MYIAQSTIANAGYGLFAKRKLSAFELKETLHGKLRDWADVRASQTTGVYLMSAGANMVWDFRHVFSFARYANTLTAENTQQYGLTINCRYASDDHIDAFAPTYLTNIVNVNQDQELFAPYNLS